MLNVIWEKTTTRTVGMVRTPREGEIPDLRRMQADGGRGVFTPLGCQNGGALTAPSAPVSLTEASRSLSVLRGIWESARDNLDAIAQDPAATEGEGAMSAGGQGRRALQRVLHQACASGHGR